MKGVLRQPVQRGGIHVGGEDLGISRRREFEIGVVPPDNADAAATIVDCFMRTVCNW